MFFNKLINFFDKSGVWPSPTPPPLNLHMIQTTFASWIRCWISQYGQWLKPSKTEFYSCH